MTREDLIQYLTQHHIDELRDILAYMAENSSEYNSITWNCEFGSVTLTVGKAKEICEPSFPLNLDEEVKEYFQGYWPGMETPEQCNSDLHFTPPAIMRLVEHFYELGFYAKPKSIWHDASEEPIFPCNVLFIYDNENVFLYRFDEKGRTDDGSIYWRSCEEYCSKWAYLSDILPKED